MMKKTVLAAMSAALILMNSCSTANQFYGTATGASLGGLFGSAIGGIAGGHRGHNAGTVAGMVIGGIIGAAATAPKTEDGNYRTSDYGREGGYDYRQNNSYSPYADIVIENLRFIDSNENNSIDAGEQAKLVFDIRNNGSDYAYDIAPVITVTGTKQILISPTAIISELAPGRAVRYQAEVIATNKLKTGKADFSIGFSEGNRLYTLCSFNLDTWARNARPASTGRAIIQ